MKKEQPLSSLLPQEPEAEQMLHAFHSVGANRFDVTWTTLQEEKAEFRRGVAYQTLFESIGSVLEEAIYKEQSIIIRPHTRPPVFLLQLDDLGEESAARVQPYAFLIVQTSPGNFQAWIALQEADEAFCRGVRRGVGADMTASGATRLGGSYNFKERYAPNFPLVEITHVSLGHIATREALEQGGLVARPETVSASLPARSIHGERRSRIFPDYERCLEGAPLNHSGTAHDRSRADFTFCLLAIDWGFGVEETAARLMEVSSKAQENGAKYARLTAERAEQAVRRRQKP